MERLTSCWCSTPHGDDSHEERLDRDPKRLQGYQRPQHAVHYGSFMMSHNGRQNAPIFPLPGVIPTVTHNIASAHNHGQMHVFGAQDNHARRQTKQRPDSARPKPIKKRDKPQDKRHKVARKMGPSQPFKNSNNITVTMQRDAPDSDFDSVVISDQKNAENEAMQLPNLTGLEEAEEMKASEVSAAAQDADRRVQSEGGTHEPGNHIAAILNGSNLEEEKQIEEKNGREQRHKKGFATQRFSFEKVEGLGQRGRHNRPNTCNSNQSSSGSRGLSRMRHSLFGHKRANQSEEAKD